ncbi:DUF4056 domain-containing protein [Shewanella marisflavi]|uniref:DUF4056 domain-containing protein n=2 Tax=Shewanella marisflavi TaxID=260364 RepID=A0AAC9U3T3_9GAMM|nr:hypothetical protein CFF01_17550 [Shewanella marisflavi]
MNRMFLRYFYALSACYLLAGCAANSWQIHSEPTSDEVAEMLTVEQPATKRWNMTGSNLPQLTVPQNVRPCCAFGDMQKVNLGSVPIPFFRLRNVVGLEHIGPHKFASGIYHYTPSSSSALGHGGGESNGILYSAKGGFIDLAHVRDTADDTIGLFFEILSNLGNDHRIELPAELGPRYIEMKAFDVLRLNDEQKWLVAAHLAARLAYFKAESHEIAQWHGYASFSGWPETISAYSLEDLYSNMLGAKITLNLIKQHKVLSETDYNQNASLWLNATLKELGIVEKAESKAVLAAVDGIWWNSQEPIPNKYMVLQRHYDLGDRQVPYLLPKALADQYPDLQHLADASPTVISLPANVESVELDDVAKLVLEIDASYAETFNHIPAAIWSTRIEHPQFPVIAQYAKEQDSKDLEMLKTDDTEN